jgi:hypothetical protein
MCTRILPITAGILLARPVLLLLLSLRPILGSLGFGCFQALSFSLFEFEGLSFLTSVRIEG